MTTFNQITFGGHDILTPTSTDYEELQNILFGMLRSAQDRVKAQTQGDPFYYRTADEAKDYISALEDDSYMTPVHEHGNVITIDEDYCALLWESSDPEYKDDPDYMAGIIFKLNMIEGQPVFEPAAMIVGDCFEGVFQYRSTCCRGEEGAYSMAIFAEQGDTIRHIILDTEVTHKGCLQKFAQLPNGIQVSSDEIKHMLHHHREGPGAHCGRDHKDLPKGPVVT